MEGDVEDMDRAASSTAADVAPFERSPRPFLFCRLRPTQVLVAGVGGGGGGGGGGCLWPLRAHSSASLVEESRAQPILDERSATVVSASAAAGKLGVLLSSGCSATSSLASLGFFLAQADLRVRGGRGFSFFRTASRRDALRVSVMIPGCSRCAATSSMLRLESPADGCCGTKNFGSSLEPALFRSFRGSGGTGGTFFASWADVLVDVAASPSGSRSSSVTAISSSHGTVLQRLTSRFVVSSASSKCPTGLFGPLELSSMPTH